MPKKIDAREVLKYLNELGYTNIDAQQLKEFIKDLKRLIKYEEKLQKSNVETNHSSYNENYVFSESNNFPQSSTKSSFEEQSSRSIRNDIFSALYNQETVASEAKKKKKESVISVHIKKPSVDSQKYVPHIHCIHDSVPTDTTMDYTQHKSRSDSDLLRSQVSNSQLTLSTADAMGDVIDSMRPRSCPKTSKSKTTVKPKVSFIRPRMCKTFKTDPVALYHQYQAEWKKNKIPGEDSRSDLRWAIRERMLGDPSVMSTASSVECLARKRYKSCCRA